MPSKPDGRLAEIVGFRIVTADLPRLRRFYVDTLGFAADGTERPIAAEELSLLGLGGTGVRQVMRLGTETVAIDCFAEAGAPYTDGNAASPWFQHLAIVVSDMSVAHRRVAAASTISQGGPQRLPPSSGGVTAFKFRDPDGHPLELIEFPAGAVPEPWRTRPPAPGAIGLGIDHSAISVTDPDASAAFYRPLGLTPGQRSLNRGPEQERLDGLVGVVLDVVPLLPPSGVPHLELLGYRVPRERGGAALLPNDVAATRIAWRSLAPAMFRDPDGHLHQLVTETGAA